MLATRTLPDCRRSCWLGPSHATRAEGHGTPSACSSLSVFVMLRKSMKETSLVRLSIANKYKSRGPVQVGDKWTPC